MGLSRESSGSDISSFTNPTGGQNWTSSNGLGATQHDFPERAPSTNGDLDDFPFAPAQCHARTLLDKDQVPERELKRCKEFAEKTCTGLGLAADSLAQFSQLCHADMIIKLQASIISLKQQNRQDETQKYITSEEFKDVLKERLRCCLLSPNLTGYVVRTASKILEYAKKNTATFKIPEKGIEDPEILDSIATMVRDLLTSQRSNIKQKVCCQHSGCEMLIDRRHAKLANSMKPQNMWFISFLARTLGPGSHFEITTNHWARYAFLRSSMVTFNGLVDEGRLATVNCNQSSRNMNADSNATNRRMEEGAAADDLEVSMQTSVSGNDKQIWTSNEFWEFVDLLLAKTRAEAAKQDSTVQGQQKILETCVVVLIHWRNHSCSQSNDAHRMFTKCLQADMKLYPPGPSQLSTAPSERVTL
ncbi:hypothetical protein JVT61DRAFT_13478 [Boletus reticuloceps]|uniref:Uncharacterized protein n=1 Tax=Boletus reticuloceps TaxID=495285 RepID=A0A8I3A3H6_9AGAM|nr:hypothetical protein JVT61DRAFT_13478 [Boletus reticuloceps]